MLAVNLTDQLVGIFRLIEEQLPYYKAPKIVDFQSKFDNTCRDLKQQIFVQNHLLILPLQIPYAGTWPG